jgi:DNA-binding NarL/FixJ family response regulator
MGVPSSGYYACGVTRNGKSGTAKATLRTLVAGRSPASTAGLLAMLSDQDGIEVVGSANKAIEALILIENLQPDVVLLDVAMPGDSLLSVLQLVKRAPRVPVVMVLTPYPSRVFPRRCRAAGADYVFTTTADLERIASTLQELRANKQTSQKGSI